MISGTTPWFGVLSPQKEALQADQVIELDPGVLSGFLKTRGLLLLQAKGT